MEPPQTTTEVRCSTCHRVEHWRDGSVVTVITSGGCRKPAPHPELAAWRAIRTAMDEGLAVVGACSRCEQPMVGRGPWHSWTLQTPEGPVTLHGGQLPSDWPRDRLDPLLERAWDERFRLSEVKPTEVLWRGSILSLMTVPIAAWLIAVLVVLSFLSAFFMNPWAVLPTSEQGVLLPTDY